jgi:predicted NBD/HSP70 family sugar kinase
MRRIDPRNFKVATRGTSREINRRIALSLVRARQPISRADLARLMRKPRSAAGLLVNDLIARKLVFEGATGPTLRGRRPKFLYIDSRGRCVVAVDIRVLRTYIMVTDFVGHQLVSVMSFPTLPDPQEFAEDLVRRIKAILEQHRDVGRCEGVGVVVPGMVDHGSGRVLLAPNLRWRDVPLREPLEKGLGLPVQLENSGRACALAQVWSTRNHAGNPPSLVFVSVSDGLGVGVVVHGELLRGQHNIAGEFGHMPISIDGPRCGCGRSGCWQAYVSNLATLSRYFGRDLRLLAPDPRETLPLSIDDLMTRARGGDGKAAAAVQETARYLGLGLGALMNVADPAIIYLSGEITTVWDMIEPTVRAGLAERALIASAAGTPIQIVPAEQYPRLRGAAALVAAPAFAAPVVA